MAVKRAVKVRDGEKLDDSTVERVIDLLEGEQPITKKTACQILNIPYNTTRLGNIIADYMDKKERRKKNFEKNKGKPLSDMDISLIVKGALTGETISEMSEMLFISPQRVNRVIYDLGVPRKDSGHDYVKVAPLPDECVLSKVSIGQIVWSARYQSAAEVIKYEGRSRDGLSDVYRIYVYERTESRRRGGFYASQRIEELGRLHHLEKYIDINKLVN